MLADWAMGVPEQDMALKTEPLARSPAYMKVAPQLMLRYFRWRDNRAARRDGTPLPPHH